MSKIKFGTFLFVLILSAVTFIFITPETTDLLQEGPEGVEILLAFCFGILHLNLLLSFSLLVWKSDPMPAWLKIPVFIAVLSTGTIATLLSLQGSYILSVVSIALTYIMIKFILTKRTYLRTGIWILGWVTLFANLFLAYFFRT